MGYSWISVTADDVNQDEIFDEIHANIDSVLSSLEASAAWPWTYDAESGLKIDNTHMSEIELAVEYADSINYCRDHNNSNVVGDEAAHNHNYKSVHDNSNFDDHLSVDHNDYSTGCTSHYSTQYYQNETDHYTDHDGTIYVNHKSQTWNTHYLMAMNYQNNGIQGEYLSSHLLVENNWHEMFQNQTVNSDLNISHLGDDYLSVYDINFGGHNSYYFTTVGEET
jgi:hypothetical protein